MIYHEDDYALIGYDEDIHATYLKFKRKGVSKEFRKAHLKALELYKLKGVGKHFTNTAKMGVLSMEDQVWLPANFIQPLLALNRDHGVFLGVVVSNDVFEKFATDNIGKKSNQMPGVIHQVFPSEEEMKQWLKGQDPYGLKTRAAG